MAVLTHAQLVTLWEVEGGSALDADTAAAIALAESGGNTAAINNTAYPSRPGYHTPSPGAQKEYSVGLWQINMLAHANYTQASLLTQTGNVAAAIAISGNGSNFQPWSTYTSGAYRQYLTSPGVSTPGGTLSVSTRASLQPTRSMKGWNALIYAIASDVPTALHRSTRLHAAALRELDAGRKLRGARG